MFYFIYILLQPDLDCEILRKFGYMFEALNGASTKLVAYQVPVRKRLVFASVVAEVKQAHTHQLTSKHL